MPELKQATYEESFASDAAGGFERWKSGVAKVFPPLSLSHTVRTPFSGSIRAAGSDELHMSHISSTPHLVDRRPDLITRTNQGYLKLTVHLKGQSLLNQSGREVSLQPGDITLYDTSRPYTLVQEQDYSMLIAMFPRKSIQALAPDAPLLAGIKLGTDSGLAAIVSDYLKTLDKNLATLTGPAGQRISRAGLDLIGSLLATETGNAPDTEPHSLTLRRIQGFIEENLHDPELSPTSIAAAHYMSVRHLHGLFQAEGSTVAALIRSQRLERCRRDLADPLLADRSISAIAGSWGILDAGHFSKLFRATYGETPSQFRGTTLNRR